MPLFWFIVAWTICAGLCLAQAGGGDAYAKFLEWRKSEGKPALNWDAEVKAYTEKLRAEGQTEEQAKKTLSIIESRDEATLYDAIFAKPAKFDTNPNRLLVDAIKSLPPGKALDVGMGQGRNAIYLARKGWQVTGFDVSSAGLSEAKKLAAAADVQIKTILASDEEFEFGTNQWDLIAIIYPIEKRSVYRVRQALKTGGVVVVECSHKESANAPFEHGTNELLRIFDGFRIIRYEDTVDLHEWAQKRLRLVRLIAQKEN